MPESGASPYQGRLIGHYRLGERIGEGGMGEVYLAEREDEFRKRAAVKLIRPGMASPEVVRRFVIERQTLAALNHPHIVRLVDGGATEEGLPYLVVDYVEGTPIDRYADEHKLSITERLRLFVEVCEAVHHAHQSLIVHCDLKPSNILVTAEGVPMLLDFGIAKLLDPASMGISAQAAIPQAGPAGDVPSPKRLGTAGLSGRDRPRRGRRMGRRPDPRRRNLSGPDTGPFRRGHANGRSPRDRPGFPEGVPAPG